jgi:hypothetical protein
MKLSFMILFLVCHPLASFAEDSQPMTLPEQKIDSTDVRIKESYQIIDDIKAQNPPDAFRIEYRQGLMQVFSNSQDSIELNRLKSIPFFGLETTTKLYENIGFDARGYYAKNFLFETGEFSPNKADAVQYNYDLGFRYRFVLDATQIDDYVAVKLLYTRTVNNFNLIDTAQIYMKEYTGIAACLERNIPVTPKIDILASLDLNYILNAESDTTGTYEQTGIGFMMRGAAHYRVDWFGLNSRIGGAYWQGGAVNKLTDETRVSAGRSSHVQTFRAVSASYVINF